MSQRQLRAWQAAAWKAWESSESTDFLAVATPGAGKTSFALHAAASRIASGEIDKLVVVAPTSALRAQWADAAAGFGIPLDPHFTNGRRMSPEYLGPVVTYAQVAAAAEGHAGGVSRSKTMVILDEIHHAGESLSWGSAVELAYRGARRRLALTGTPFRSDQSPIPFVSYEAQADGSRVSRADHLYGYAQALADGVVRPVVFLTYGGEGTWRDRAGAGHSAQLGKEENTQVVNARAWRAALDPRGEWIQEVLVAADARLSQVRAGGMPDAGGLVLASDQASAKAYARVLSSVCGESVALITTDQPGAEEELERFGMSGTRWCVAVRMVSEGVDIPRLAVGVYATNAATPLFFAQAVGRFVRARNPQESATVFLPKVPQLLALAEEMERERDHVLGGREVLAEKGLLVRAARSERASEELLGRVELTGSSASFGGIILNGASWGGEGMEGMLETLPCVLDREQLAAALASSQNHVLSGGGSGESLHRQVGEMRRELARLVGIHHGRTGLSPATIHHQLRVACGGPAVAQASLEQLRARVRYLVACG